MRNESVMESGSENSESELSVFTLEIEIVSEDDWDMMYYEN